MFQQASSFRWRDKLGRVWETHQIDDPGVSVFSARSRSVIGKCIAYVLTSGNDLNHLPFAILADIRVDRRMENRGLGSMLLSRVIVYDKGKIPREDVHHPMPSSKLWVRRHWWGPAIHQARTIARHRAQRPDPKRP